ncbi:MAG: hypothetical protein JW891_17710, partial [Candidatus Lokiarchaeota archaeon]|nr:hypothetical protein [Candidatus Lokiarchaeota archaeon]
VAAISMERFDIELSLSAATLVVGNEMAYSELMCYETEEMAITQAYKLGFLSEIVKSFATLGLSLDDLEELAIEHGVSLKILGNAMLNSIQKLSEIRVLKIPFLLLRPHNIKIEPLKEGIVIPEYDWKLINNNILPQDIKPYIEPFLTYLKNEYGITYEDYRQFKEDSFSNNLLKLYSEYRIIEALAVACGEIKENVRQKLFTTQGLTELCNLIASKTGPFGLKMLKEGKFHIDENTHDFNLIPFNNLAEIEAIVLDSSISNYHSLISWFLCSNELGVDGEKIVLDTNIASFSKYELALANFLQHLSYQNYYDEMFVIREQFDEVLTKLVFQKIEAIKLPNLDEKGQELKPYIKNRIKLAFKNEFLSLTSESRENVDTIKNRIYNWLSDHSKKGHLGEIDQAFTFSLRYSRTYVVSVQITFTSAEINQLFKNHGFLEVQQRFYGSFNIYRNFDAKNNLEKRIQLQLIALPQFIRQAWNCFKQIENNLLPAGNQQDLKPYKNLEDKLFFRFTYASLSKDGNVIPLDRGVYLRAGRYLDFSEGKTTESPENRETLIAIYDAILKGYKVHIATREGTVYANSLNYYLSDLTRLGTTFNYDMNAYSRSQKQLNLFIDGFFSEHFVLSTISPKARGQYYYAAFSDEYAFFTHLISYNLLIKPNENLNPNDNTKKSAISAQLDLVNWVDFAYLHKKINRILGRSTNQEDIKKLTDWNRYYNEIYDDVRGKININRESLAFFVEFFTGIDILSFDPPTDISMQVQLDELFIGSLYLNRLYG